jgi:N-methylhydantoinase B
MNNHFATSLLEIYLNEFLSDMDSGVILNEANEILALRYENLPDIGTYGPMVKTVSRYFHPEEGDFVLLNDPYSGGTLLFSIGFVTAIRVNQQKFYFASRIRLKPDLVFAKRIEEEGVRIPPTPLVTQGQVNMEILDAIASNPLAPPLFRQSILDQIQVMQERVKQFHSIFRIDEKLFSPTNQKNMLAKARRKALEKMAELPHGDAKYESRLDTGETLRLKTELTAEKLIFDFQGTSTSQGTYLTDVITYGACVGGLLAFLGPDISLNEGIYSVVEVSTPQGSFLSAKYPSPLSRGAIEGLPQVATAALNTLSEIIPHKAIAHNYYITPTLTLDFKNQSLIDVMPNGTAATASTHGIDGLYFWQRNGRSMSVEALEKAYPLLMHQNGIREGSGGKGQYRGGDGIVREYQVLAPCEARWIVGSQNQQPKGLKGGGSGSPPEIKIIRKDGREENQLPSAGTAHLEPQDRIILMSSGGGGYGKSAST